MLSKWQVVYFAYKSGKNPIREFLDGLDSKKQAKILRVFQYVAEYGLESVIPHLKKLSSTPFWEIRILGKDNIRIIYVVPIKYMFLVLHGFIKKKQKTSIREIEIAFRRYEDWQRR